MKMATKASLMAVGIFLLVAASTYSQDMIDARNPATIMSLADGWGSATLETDSVGDPKIVGRMDGTRYTIYFYGCDDSNENCGSITFRSGWNVDDISYSDINNWNRTKRFSKASLDSDNNPTIETDINLDCGGVTVENMENNFDYWRLTLSSFTEYLQGL